MAAQYYSLHSLIIIVLDMFGLGCCCFISNATAASPDCTNFPERLKAVLDYLVEQTLLHLDIGNRYAAWDPPEKAAGAVKGMATCYTLDANQCQTCLLVDKNYFSVRKPELDYCPLNANFNPFYDVLSSGWSAGRIIIHDHGVERHA